MALTCTCAGGDEAAHYKHEMDCERTNGKPTIDLDTEVAELEEILRDDWYELSKLGDNVDGFETVDRIEGNDRRWFRCITVITQGPSGQLYQWEFDHGLTEHQESELRDQGGGWIARVQRIEEEVTVTNVRYESE